MKRTFFICLTLLLCFFPTEAVSNELNEDLNESQDHRVVCARVFMEIENQEHIRTQEYDRGMRLGEEYRDLQEEMKRVKSALWNAIKAKDDTLYEEKIIEHDFLFHRIEFLKQELTLLVESYNQRADIIMALLIVSAADGCVMYTKEEMQETLREECPKSEYDDVVPCARYRTHEGTI